MTDPQSSSATAPTGPVPSVAFRKGPLTLLTRMNAPLIESTRLRLTWLLAILVGWSVFILGLRWYAWETGITLGDIHLFTNSLINTNFSDQWLYVAEYEASRGFITLLQDHFEPTLMLLTWPVQWFGAFALIILSTLFALFPAVFLYCAVRTVFPMAPLAALGAAAAFLFNEQYMLAITSYIAGFYPETMQLVLIPAAIWLRSKGQNLLFWLVFILSMGVKETSGLIWVGYGFAVMILSKERERIFGFKLMMIAGLTMTYAIFIWPMHFGGQNIYLYLAGNATGGTDLDRAVNVLVNDWITIFTETWAAFAAPVHVLAVLPEVAFLGLLGKHSHQHYVLPVFAMLGAGAALGAARISLWTHTRPWVGAIAAVILAVHVLIGLTHGVHQVIRPYYKNADYWVHAQAGAIEDEWVESALADIDTSCGVAADVVLFSRVNHLPRWYGFVDFPTADFARYWITADVPFVEWEKWYSLHAEAQKRSSDQGGPLTLLGQHGDVWVWENTAAQCVETGKKL